VSESEREREWSCLTAAGGVPESAREPDIPPQELLRLQEVATVDGVGVWAPGEGHVRAPQTVADTAALLATRKGVRTPCLVEYVANGGTLRLTLLDDWSTCAPAGSPLAHPVWSTCSPSVASCARATADARKTTDVRAKVLHEDDTFGLAIRATRRSMCSPGNKRLLLPLSATPPSLNHLLQHGNASLSTFTHRSLGH
jgi:hypothetical protein